MRKAFWCGCAGMLAAAVCVYGAAACATHYPDSLVVQTGKLAWRVCTDWNPAVQLGRTVASTTNGYLQPSKPERTCSGATVACAQPADPGPGVVPPSVIEVIDLSGFQVTGVYPQDDDLVQVEVRGVDPITVLPGAIEEAEAPAEMPPAEEEAQEAKPVKIEVQEEKPAEDVEQEAKVGAFERWLSLVEFAEDAELLPMPSVEDAEGAAEQLPAPQEGELTEDAPEESEPGSEDGTTDCKETDYHHRYPECPYGGGCPGMYKSK